jgi:ATP-binding cassette subfamily B protein
VALSSHGRTSPKLHSCGALAGRTVLFISHRCANVRMADRVYVLDDGRIAEHRTQESLMERDGIYARLFRMQAEGYRVGPEPRVEVCQA